ncbi:MAG: DUF3047 domain-containing protein [Pseudomonadota bacterium]
MFDCFVTSNPRARRVGWAIACVVALSACAVPTLAPVEEPGGVPVAAVVPLAEATEWHAVHFPGKRATEYRHEQKEGRIAVAARADRSASMWRRNVVRSADRLGEVEFSWWVQAMPNNADVSQAEFADAPARVMFAFAGDTRRLSARNQMLFDLAHVLSGEPLPFATLIYVWDAKAPVGSVIVNPRSDRIRKIVVESGTTGLRQWRSYRRNLAADFRLAFGEAPGSLQAMAVMTDGDNTQSQLATWYGEITLH